MADTEAIQNRINSIRDTRKITNAMYLISSTKLRKARKSLDETRPFFDALRDEIGIIAKNVGLDESRYFITEGDSGHENGKCGILIITADKGLAGAYNQNVIKKSLEIIKEFPDNRLFISGEYGRHYFTSHGIPIDEKFNFPDYEPTLYTARMMAGYIMDLYDHEELSQIYIIYTNFKNALSSEVCSIRLLPFEKEHFDKSDDVKESIDDCEYIPSPMEVMERSIPVYCIGMIYSVLVYSFCCEQNDRMMAMDNANQNADKLLKELTLKYNRLRQSGITQEITEISASVKASHRK